MKKIVNNNTKKDEKGNKLARKTAMHDITQSIKTDPTVRHTEYGRDATEMDRYHTSKKDVFNKESNDLNKKIKFKKFNKKVNEDVAITDPSLAQQYSNGKQQLVNKDSQINALNRQILKLQQDKIKIQQALDQIEKKSAESIGKPAVTPDANQPKTNQNTDLAKAQQALAAQVLMNKPTTESLYINSLNDKLRSLNEIKYSSSNPDAIKLEINQIESEIFNLTKNFDNPFASNIFYNVSEAYEDIDD